MTISVIIPTYRRPEALEHGLQALTRQVRRPDEVVVVRRATDDTPHPVLKRFADRLPLRSVEVTASGQVAALNAGLVAASGDILAITDDDTRPHPDWLERIERHFLADPDVGGVGGRDWVHLESGRVDETCEEVGRVQWFGRMIGNHHLGVGEAREVEVLKGANMSYRRAAVAWIRFDERLKGTGAQVYNDSKFSLTVRRAGWKLIYDPAVAVDHYPAQRFDVDQRRAFNPVAQREAVHNETLQLLDYLSAWQRIAFVVWAFWIGTRRAYGVAQILRFMPVEGPTAVRKWWATINGRVAGWLTWYRYSTSDHLQT